MQTSEDDIVTVLDSVLAGEYAWAVSFLQKKYNCSQEDAILTVDEIVAGSEIVSDKLEQPERWDGLG